MSRADEIIAKLFVRFLGEITAEDCQESILINKPLFKDVSEQDWNKYRKIAWPIKNLAKVDVNYNAVVEALSKNRPDILSRICTTPGGVDWLKIQVEDGRQKLGFCESGFVKD